MALRKDQRLPSSRQEEIRDALRTARAAGIHLKKLASIAGYSQYALANIVSGYNAISPAGAERILRAIRICRQAQADAMGELQGAETMVDCPSGF